MASRKPSKKSAKKLPAQRPLQRTKRPVPRKVVQRSDNAPFPAGQAIAFPETSKSYVRWRNAAFLIATVIFFLPLSFPLFGDLIHLEALLQEGNRHFQETLGLMQKGDLDKAVSLLSPDAREGAAKSFTPLVEALQKVGPFQACHLVNFSWHTNGSLWEMVYYLDYQKASGLVDFKYRPEGDGFVVDTFIVHAVSETFHEACEFPSLLDISIIKLIFFLFAYLLLLLNAKTLVRCCYTPLKRKWLWILFILLGVGSITGNLSPDSIFHINFLNFNLLVTSLSKSPLLEPWKVEMTLPLGMLVFLMKY